MPIPPSTEAALAGATILANLSASNATIGKYEYREILVSASSGRNNAVQMYSAAGFGESTSDLAWDGHGIVAERGNILARTKRFQLEGTDTIADVDLDSLVSDRMRQTSQRQNASDHSKTFRVSSFTGRLGINSAGVFDSFRREIPKFPFVPSDAVKRDERCRDTFMIQATSLARWLLTRPESLRKLVVGVSGGQDSTHALLVAAHTMDLLGLSRANIIAITMPGFGTTGRTYSNACALIHALRATFHEIDVKPIALELMKSIGHDLGREDVVFQNAQAWGRKLIELALGAKLGATDLGTGDLSELMLGWCTMFGDHAAHYGVNAGVPKTLISYLIRWNAEVIFKDDEKVRTALFDILETPISPELLTARDGQITHKTEEEIGPYCLHDFTGYYFLRFGFSPVRIARMCYEAWKDVYSLSEIKKWMRVFFERFFPAQMKRSVLPLGPKVGGAAISPRGDWRMPADVSPVIWLEDLARVPDTIESKSCDACG